MPLHDCWFADYKTGGNAAVLWFFRNFGGCVILHKTGLR
jgi:hypothetical protein